MVAPVPFQALVAYAKSISVGSWNCCTSLRGAALRSREIKPNAPQPKGSFEIIETDIDVALRVAAVLRNDVRPRACQICHGDLANVNIPVFDTRPVAAHVQGIKVVYLDMIPAVVSFARPELCVRLAL